MKLILVCGLLVLSVIATGKGLAQQASPEQLLNDYLLQYPAENNAVLQRMKELQKHRLTEQVKQRKRQEEAFKSWIFKYYGIELEIVAEEIADKHFDQFVDKLKKSGATKDEISQALVKAEDKLGTRIGIETLNELKNWFRRDFPNTPFGKIPRL